MSMAKAVVTGTIFRAPEERFTQNGVAVYSFVLNIDEKEETLIRVLSTRTATAPLMKSLSKGDKIVVYKYKPGTGQDFGKYVYDSQMLDNYIYL